MTTSFPFVRPPDGSSERGMSRGCRVQAETRPIVGNRDGSSGPDTIAEPVRGSTRRSIDGPQARV